MDLRQALLKEHSRAQMMRIVKFVGNDAAKFKSLVTLFLKGPYRITQRAAWPLSYCVEHHPKLIAPHLNAILKHLEKPDASDSARRNTVRFLQFIELPKRVHGRVADICFRFLANKKEPIAIRVFSMSVLATIASSNPGLRNELIIMIEDELPYSSAGFISR